MARQPKQPKATATAAPTDYFIARERLFARLDDLTERAVWLQGPTGAGKTVLLRTYVRHRATPALWLASDAKSTTPDALFNALAQAAQRGGVNDLPQFAGEHRQAPAEFLRLCAERVAQQLPGAIVVVDDAQRLLPALASVLQVLIDACCTDLRLLFAGQDWPLGLEAHIASAKLVVVGHEQLAFDQEEASELARRVGAAEELAQSMREKTSGWAAGLMLSLQLGQGATPANAQRRLEGPLSSLVHGGVLSGVEPETVKALAALASARYIPAALTELSEPWTQAVAELERLSERGLFVERLDNGDLRLHDLFCSALRQEPVEDEQRDAAVLALSKIDRCELALLCLVTNPDCGEKLDRWLATHGDQLLRLPDVGNLCVTVLEACKNLPRNVLLWCSRAAMASDLDLADKTAEKAFQAMLVNNDDAGARCCCGIGLLAQSLLLEAQRLEVWKDRYGNLPLPSSIVPEQIPMLEGAARVFSHVLRSAANGPDIQSFHGRFCELLQTDQPPQEAILAGSVAVYALLHLQQRDQILPLIASIEGTAWFPRTPKYSRIDWHMVKALMLGFVGRLEDSVSSLSAASAMAEQEGLRRTLCEAWIGQSRALFALREVDAAEALLDRAAGLPDDPGVILKTDELRLRAGIALARGQVLRALTEVEAAEELLRLNDLPSRHELERARVQVLYAMGKQHAALAHAVQCASRHDGAAREMAECDRLLLSSLSCWNEKPEAARGDLMLAVELIEQRRWTNFLALLPQEAGTVACRALKSGRTVDVIRDSIRERRLPAPKLAGPQWPWPVRLYLTGNWRLEIFGSAVESQGKAQRKPLELAKFLACARDQSADHLKVCSALWSDSDDQAAKRSLEMTTSRLRELLGNPRLVRVSDGRTSLDPEYVWCDAQELLHLCDEAETFDQTPAKALVIETAESLLGLYRGPLLMGDEETPWVIGAREKMKAAFVRAVRALTEKLLRIGESALALQLLERAFSMEPLAEELAQRLMEVHVEVGQASDALRVYRHLRQMLSLTIGSKPSSASERIRQSIDLN